MSRPLVLEQSVDADPARVWAAWTSAEQLATWWWPHIPDTTYRVDARPGGSYEIRSEAAGIGVRGEFLELDPPRSMRMTWIWLNDDTPAPEERASVELSPADGGTRVTVTHELNDDVGDDDGIRQGWTDVVGRLAQTLRGR